MHSSVGVSDTSVQQRSANTFGLYLPVYLFSIRGISLWNISPCSSETATIFPKKKIQVGLQEMEFQQHVAPQGTVCGK
jgi:hypothetical protein